MDEAATMRAIRDILSEDQGAADKPGPAAATPAVPRRAPAAMPVPTLQPVRDIHAKLRPARFTTVPGAQAPVSEPAAPKASDPRAAKALSPAAQTDTARAWRSARLGKLPLWSAGALLLACAMLYPAPIVLPILAGAVSGIAVLALLRAGRAPGFDARVAARLERMQREA